MPKKTIKKTKKHMPNKRCQHLHKIFHIAHHIHHHLGHGGELAIIAFIFIANLFSAGFSANVGTGIELISDHTIIATNLLAAEKKGAPGINDNKIISSRTMDGSVDNSFYPGYCTYGAARISPEFFPFIEEKKQQRTWGGNAIDRCTNAQATGFKIGSTPSVGSLIVYGNGGAGGIFGHVGKIMYYNSKKKSLIVRDMNRIGKFTMTDRREESDDAKIKCFIYPTKTQVVINDTLPVNTGNTAILQVTSTGTIIQINTGTINTVPLETEGNPAELDKGGGSEAEGGFVPPITPEPILPVGIINEKIIIKDIQLNFDNVSDLAKHFLTQRNIQATFSSKENIKIGDNIMLTLTIKDFNGLLDVPFEIITSNNNISSNYSAINLIKDGKIEIQITAEKAGDATLLINFDGEKIGKVNFVIE